MFRLTRQVRFALDPRRRPSAGQRAINAHGGHPPVIAAAPFLMLDVCLSGALDPDSAYVRNIQEIDRAVRDRCLPRLFAGAHERQLSPVALALEAKAALRDAFPGAVLESVVLHLSPFARAEAHRSETPMVRLSQRFEFSASHRLHNPALSDEQNRQTFGKCNNPHGHGHNYELQVTLRGRPDASGTLIDVPAFEQVVRSAVIDRFDHRHLNTEVEEFRALIPSVENIARVIFDLLKPAFASGRAELAAVTVWETPKTFAEYTAD